MLTLRFNPSSSSSSSTNPWRPVLQTHHSTYKLTITASQSNPSSSGSTAGKITRDVLPSSGRTKLDPSSDRDFYASPRFVTHVDDAFIATLTNLYRERLRPEFEVLDLMSSWVSHLPRDVEYRRVVGHGLNAEELARNKRLEYFVVKDLNSEQRMEFESGRFDAVLCAVGVQYLQQPEKVFAEVFRMLKPGVSFSNRMFYEKAISAWRDGTPYSRAQLVVQYFQCIDGFTQPEVIKNLPQNSDPSKQSKGPLSWMLGFHNLFSGSDPFYAVVAYKNFKPIYE